MIKNWNMHIGCRTNPYLNEDKGQMQRVVQGGEKNGTERFSFGPFQ